MAAFYPDIPTLAKNRGRGTRDQNQCLRRFRSPSRGLGRLRPRHLGGATLSLRGAANCSAVGSFPGSTGVMPT
jgi:hypothetical protein